MTVTVPKKMSDLESDSKVNYSGTCQRGRQKGLSLIFSDLFGFFKTSEQIELGTEKRGNRNKSEQIRVFPSANPKSWARIMTKIASDSTVARMDTFPRRDHFQSYFCVTLGF